MSNTIESLEIEIIGSSQSAEQALDALEGSLSRLKTAVRGGCGLTAVTNQLTAMNNALGSMKSSNIANLKALSDGLQTLSSVGNFKLSSSVANQITNLGTATAALNGADFTKLTDLATALTPLSAVGKANLGSTINQLGKLPGVIQPLYAMDMSSVGAKIRELVDAVKPLAEMGKANLSSTLNQIKKLPEAFATLNALDLTSFAKKIKEVAAALAPLADEMQKVANGFSAFPAKIQKLLNATNQIPKANSKAGISYVNLAAKISMAYVAVKRIASVVASWINKSNDYIESFNLFNVSLGSYAEEAYEYAQSVGAVMGINPAEWMENQGVFMTLATGFGVASDRAYTMSQNLTQLGYDIASFRNLTTEDAFQKLQSGISGELEPLRRLGYDLSQARLEAVALSLGIDKAVSSMTQAEKAELRYYAIMTQVTTAQGDMARTLNDPANQLRVLKAQLEQAATALGNIFSPVLNAVLPYLIAVAQVIHYVANAIAALFGFSMEPIDSSGLTDVSSGASDASDAIEDANGSAKELRKTLLGIDELNVMPDTSSSGSTDLGGGGGFDFELPEYGFTKALSESRVAQIVEEMKEWLGLTEDIDSWSDLLDTRLGHILKLVGLIGVGLAAWKIAKGLVSGIQWLQTLKSKNFTWSFSVLGASLFIADLDRLKKYVDDIAENGITFSNAAGVISEFAGLVGDALIILGKTEYGAALKVVQGIGEIVSAISDMTENGIDVENALTVVRGVSNIGIAIGLFTGNLKLAGAATAIQGVTTIVEELAANWDAIKEGDWSGVDKATLVVGAIEAIGGIVTAFGVFSKIKDSVDTEKAVSALSEVTTATESINTSTVTLSTKLTSLVANLALGIVVIAEVAAAALLIVGAVWALGEMLYRVCEAWQPVIENAGTVAIAMGVGIGMMAAVGVVTGLLGSVGATLIINIALGTAILLELGVATVLFATEIWAIGEVLTEVGEAWRPVLDDAKTVEQGIAKGTELLIAIGVVSAALGVASVASAGLLPLAIGLGTALLVKLSAAVIEFNDSLVDVADSLGNRLSPALNDLNEKLPNLSRDMDDFTTFMKYFAEQVVDYSKSSAISCFSATVNEIIGFFSKDPIESMTDDVNDQYKQTKDLNEKLRLANPELEAAISLVATYYDFLGELENLTQMNSNISLASGMFVSMKEVGRNLIAGFVAGMKAEMPSLSGGVKDALNGALTSSTANSIGYTFGRNLAAGVSSGFRNSSFPTLRGTVNVTSGNIANLRLRAYASGGFPNVGEMFVAREAGPELVGTIGNKTAVANNDQIVDAVADGVYRAVVSAMGQSKDGETAIYIDGRRVFEVVKNYNNRERIRTGVNPLMG